MSVRWLAAEALVLLAVVLAARPLPAEVATMRVSSDSMAPGLVRGDLVVVVPVGDRARRGDVVVFDDPGGWAEVAARVTGRSDDVFVKRVVGVAGDRVVCCDADGRIEVDGEPVEEPYVDPELSRTQLAFDVTVGPGQLWVLGDNRDGSTDSRYLTDAPGHGMVRLSDLRGRVAWSF